MKKDKAVLLQNQVSGKHPKYTDKAGQLIYKKLSLNELNFYLTINQMQISSLDYDLQYFIPEFVGVQALELAEGDDQICRCGSKHLSDWVKHMGMRNKNNKKEASKNEQYIILKNLIQGYEETCIMDIKLGRKLQNKPSNIKFATSTTNSHNFRINGMKNYDVVSGEHSFVNKYYFQKTTEQEIQSHLAYFFYNGSNIDVSLIAKCVQIIKKLVFSLLSFKKGKFHSSSLLICYDGRNHDSFSVKLIDFDKYHEDGRDQPDNNIIEGLKYIVGYLLSIVAQPHRHQNIIKQKQLKLFYLNEKTVIPQKIITKFSQQK